MYLNGIYKKFQPRTLIFALSHTQKFLMKRPLNNAHIKKSANFKNNKEFFSSLSLAQFNHHKRKKKL